MLETHIKILASVYTALMMAAIASLLLYGGVTIKSPTVKGRIIEATMIDVSQLKPRKKASKPKNTPPKKQVKQPPKQQKPKEVKTQEKPLVKVDPPAKKNPPSIVKKTPKIDTKAQELERKKDKERKKKQEDLRKRRLEKAKEVADQKQILKDLEEKIDQETNETVATDKLANKKGHSELDDKNQLMTRYQLTLNAVVKRQWNKPVSANKNLLCHVHVRQIPGGAVMSATISTPCNANSIVKKSILAAIKKAEPLPYKGFESVFDRSAIFIFQPSDD